MTRRGYAAAALGLALALAGSTRTLTAGVADAGAVAGAGAPPTIWLFPAVKHYGGVHPRGDLPLGVSPGVDYRVIVDVTHGTIDRTQVSGALERLARLVNLMAYAGVPRDHVHIAAVIEGEAGYAAFTNDAYRQRFHVDNPNLPILAELKRSGVELMVCAQALAENDLEDRDISPDVTVTLSALTDFVAYGQRGYSYLQL